MLKSLIVLLTAALLSGCAAMNRLSSEVSSFGAWPGGKAGSSFVFDRPPSQPVEWQQALEEAALPALTNAGFRLSDDASTADYVVQLGARVSGEPQWTDDFGFANPFGWRGGWPHRHPGLGIGWGYGRFGGPFASPPTYLREVAVQVRDRRSGQTAYETRASNSSYSPTINSLLPAMFRAALADFPNGGNNPRLVVTPIDG